MLRVRLYQNDSVGARGHRQGRGGSQKDFGFPALLKEIRAAVRGNGEF